MPTLNVFMQLVNPAVISLVSLNPTQRKYQDVQFKLLQHHIEFQPQWKSVR